MNRKSQQPLHAKASGPGALRGSAWCVLWPAIWLILVGAQSLVAQTPTIAAQPQSLNVAPGMKDQ